MKHILITGGPEVLRQHIRRLTAVEIDPKLARKLAKRMAGTNVEVAGMDATKLPFDDNTFSAAACFTIGTPFQAREPRRKKIH